MRRLVPFALAFTVAGWLGVVALTGGPGPARHLDRSGWTPRLVPAPARTPSPPSTVPQGLNRPTGVVLLPPASTPATVYAL
jgi:hypothetical protein